MSEPKRVDLIFESLETGLTAIVVSPKETLKKSAPWCVMIMLVVYQKLAEFQIQKKVRPVLRRNAFPVEPLQSSLRKIILKTKIKYLMAKPEKETIASFAPNS
jgi:hypothetical protein